MLKPFMMALTQKGAIAGISLSGTLTSTLIKGIAYSSGFTRHGGTSPFTYTIGSGALPTGLSIDSGTGVISGTPTGSGASTFTVHVSDSTTPTALTADHSATLTVETDASWASVVTLLGLDGAANSTTFTDSSAAAVTWTANGNAKLGTTHVKFGSAALLLDGTADWISSADVTNLNFNSKAYTVEGWAYLDQTTYSTNGKNFQCLLSVANTTSTSRLAALMNANGAFEIIEQDNGGSNTISGISANAIIPKQTWFHFAMTRDLATSGGKIYGFINGVLVCTSAAQAARSGYTGGVAHVGALGYGGADSDEWVGSIDEVRITLPVCRYTSTFTPRTLPFPRG